MLVSDMWTGEQNRSAPRQRKSGEHYRKEKEDYEGVRLLIWISVGSQQVRLGLKCYSKSDQGLGFGRTKKKRRMRSAKVGTWGWIRT